MIARVAVQDAGFPMDKLYAYLIPPGLEAEAAAGKRVSVPFARGNRRREGMVFALEEESSYPRLKPLDAWLDREPILSPEELALARWVKARFFCTYYEAVKAMLPAGVWLAGEAVCTLLKPGDREANYAAAGEEEACRELLDLLYDRGGSAPWQDVRSALGSGASAAADRLESAGILSRVLERKQRASDKVSSTAVLLVSAEEAVQFAERKRRAAPQQAELLRLLSGMGECSAKELCYFTGASMTSLKALERAGLVELQPREEFRRPEVLPDERASMDELNPWQERACSELLPMLRSGGAAAALLYGVTGSGKTAVYIRLIRETIAMGRQALVLVPEIALTPQLMSTFIRHFGDRVAVLHSSLTVAQRYDEWKRIRRQQVDVVVGTRSAVFAPLRRLGLLVVDEEQENSYKSQNAPRYHARDVAKYRCAKSDALLLLGSATPSVESMYEARCGRYALVRMDRRFNEHALPEVRIVDLKEELRRGNGSSVSALLRQELQANLDRGEQSILFLNRRGANSMVTCPACGYVYTCPRCSAKLTYHTANHRMMCHYCGYSQPADRKCPACGGSLSFSSPGTQRVEEELRALFPGMPILRMDTDTVSASRSHEVILREFRQDRVPVLLGTQMVAKGLDFENVTLVGVILADQSLYTGDYRAQERTFDLITQVVGRSGRGEKPGRAVIQTYTPGSPVILCAARQDYDAFYAEEIESRRLLLAPPFRSLYSVTVVGGEEERVLRCASQLKTALERAGEALPELRVLGPAPAGIVRVNNQYRYRVTVNAAPTPQVRALMAAALRQYGGDSRNRDLTLYGDVDAMDG
jgi:primosomal protein N' (replication factor Y)